MMNKSMFLTLVSLLSLLLTACSNTSELAEIDKAASENPTITAVLASSDTVTPSSSFPVEIVEPMIEQSFAAMASEYKMYARYFNICQKSPNDPVCGIPYKTAMSRYKQAKANDDVLELLWNSDLKSMPLPAAANTELAKSLVALGYLAVNKSHKFSLDEINQATYAWMQEKGLPKTDSILLLHQVLMKSEVLKLKMQG